MEAASRDEANVILDKLSSVADDDVVDSLVSVSAPVRISRRRGRPPKIQDVSCKASKRKYQREKEAQRRKNLNDLLDELALLCNSRDSDKETILSQAIEELKALSSQIANAENMLQSVSAQLQEAEAKHVCTRHNKIAECVNYLRSVCDESERIKVEMSRHRSSISYGSFLHSSVLIFCFSKECFCVDANYEASMQLGYARQELADMNLFQLIEMSQIEDATRRAVVLIRGKHPAMVFQRTFVGRDNVRHRTRVFLSPTYDSHGVLVNKLVVAVPLYD